MKGREIDAKRPGEHGIKKMQKKGKMSMKTDTAKKFWRKIIKLMSCDGGQNVAVSDPAIDTVVRAYCGEYNSMPDLEYTQKLKDVDELSGFWDSSTETAANLFMKAFAMTDISDREISRLAGILAQASVRSNYANQTENPNKKEGNVGTPDQPFSPESECVDWTKPRAIYDYLDKCIYGQKAAKQAVSMLVYAVLDYGIAYERSGFRNGFIIATRILCECINTDHCIIKDIPENPFES